MVSVNCNQGCKEQGGKREMMDGEEREGELHGTVVGLLQSVDKT
jgi:hypothetical protein